MAQTAALDPKSFPDQAGTAKPDEIALTLPTKPKTSSLDPSSFPDQAATMPAMKPMASHEKPSAAEDVIAKTGPMAGALAGATYGAELGAGGGPVGMAIGGVVGAGAGAFGGDLFSQGLTFLTEKLGLTPSRTGVPIQDRAIEAGNAATAGMIGQMLGESGVKVLTPVVSKIAAPFKQKLTDYAAEAIATFPPKTQTLLPGEVSNSRALTIAENVAEGSIFGGGKVSAVRAARQKEATDRLSSGLDAAFGPAVSVKDAGKAALDSRISNVKNFRNAEKAAYGAFEQAAGDMPIATPRLDEFIASQDQSGTILPNAGAHAAQRVASLIGGELPEGYTQGTFAALPETVQMAVRTQQQATNPALTAVQFQRTVGDLGKLVRALETSAKSDPSKFNAQLGLAKKLYGLAKEDLVDSLKANPQAADTYSAATEISRTGNAQLFNRQIMTLAKQAPEKIVGAVAQRNNSTAITALHKAIGDEAMEGVRRAAIDRLVRTDPGTNQINWPAVARRIQSLGPDTMNALAPNGQASDLQRFVRLMVDINRKPSTGIGKVGIMLTQWGAMAATGGALATGNIPAALASSGVLITPAVLSRIMASPAGLKWLTAGLQAPLGSSQAIKAGVMLAAFLRQQQQAEGAPTPMAAHSTQRGQ